MYPRLLVVAKSDSTVNKFGQYSFLQAVNAMDFLKETGEYEEVSIFQQVAAGGPLREWVKMAELER